MSPCQARNVVSLRKEITQDEMHPLFFVANKKRNNPEQERKKNSTTTEQNEKRKNQDLAMDKAFQKDKSYPGLAKSLSSGDP